MLSMVSAKPRRDRALEKWKRQRRAFYARLGYAISRWAYVDRQLFTFCRFALGVSEKRAAIVFYRSPNIGDHFAVTDALMKAAQLQERYLAQWARIAEKISDLLPFRNDIAHNPVVQTGRTVIILSDDQNIPGRVKSSKHWQEVRTEPKKLLHRTKGTREISVAEAELLAHIEAVADLEDDMHDLHWSLVGPPRGVNPRIRRPYLPQTSGSNSPQPVHRSKARVGLPRVRRAIAKGKKKSK